MSAADDVGLHDWWLAGCCLRATLYWSCSGLHSGYL